MRALREAILFATGGILGFFVDTVVLYALLEALGPFVGRAVSFVTAVFVTWIFNRSLTFKWRRSGLNLKAEFFAYFGLMCIGGSVNYLLYAWLISSYQTISASPVIAVAAGSVAGMAVNLSTSRFALYRSKVSEKKG